MAAARSKALEVRKRAAAGDDPKAEASSESFKACVETWTTNEQKGRKLCVAADYTQQVVLASCRRWHDRPIASLRYSEIDDLLCEIRDGSKLKRKAPYAANRAHAHLKTFFKWCVRTKRLAVSPIAEMPKPWLGAKARERPWFEGEKADQIIKALWGCADTFGGGSWPVHQAFVVSGKRRRTIEAMRWDHIDQVWYWKPLPWQQNQTQPSDTVAQARTARAVTARGQG